MTDHPHDHWLLGDPIEVESFKPAPPNFDQTTPPAVRFWRRGVVIGTYPLIVQWPDGKSSMLHRGVSIRLPAPEPDPIKKGKR